jgi:hypothetical protein
VDETIHTYSCDEAAHDAAAEGNDCGKDDVGAVACAVAALLGDGRSALRGAGTADSSGRLVPCTGGDRAGIPLHVDGGGIRKTWVPYLEAGRQQQLAYSPLVACRMTWADSMELPPQDVNKMVVPWDTEAGDATYCSCG